MNKIMTKKETKKINYSNEKLENFFVRKNLKKEMNETDFNKILKEFMEKLETRDKIYILTSNIKSNNFIKELIKIISEKKIIVFIVTKENEKINSLSKLSKIRICKDLPDTTLILKESEGKFQGMLFSGELKDDLENYILNLDRDQNLEMYRLFCKYFWEKSEKELNVINEKKEIIRMYKNIQMYKPYYEVNEKKEIFCDFLNDSEEKYMIYNDEFQNLPEKSQLIIKQKHIKNVDKLKDYNNEFFLNLDSEKINFFINEIEGFFISDLELKDNSFYISLNYNQRDDIKEYFDKIKENSQYEFIYEKNIKDINTEFFYRDINEKKKVLKIDTKILPKLKVENIEEFENYDIFSKIDELQRFDENNPCIECEYILEVEPPRLPKNIKISILVNEWEELKENFEKKLEEYERTLKIHEKKLEKEKGFFKGFKIFKLGRKRLIENYENKIKKIKEKDIYKFSKKDQKIYLNSINELSGILKFDKELKENLAKDKAENNWVKSKEKIKENIEELEEKKQKLEQEKKDKNKRKKLEKELKEKIKKIELINEKLNENRKKLEKLGKKFIYNSEEKVSSLNELNKKREEKEVKYKFPEEYINSVGKLYENKNKRYLLIEYYEELEEGKREAERLKANLCVKGE